MNRMISFTFVVVLLAGSILVCGSTPISASTTPTPLNMSPYDIANDISSNATNLQVTNYFNAIVGKSVDWKGPVDDVTNDGTIFVMLSSSNFPDITINITGIPLTISQQLNKGDTIEFIGILSRGSALPGAQLYLYIVNAKLIK